MSSAPALVQRTATRGSLDVVVDVVGLSPDPVPYARGLELQRAAAARVVAGEDRGTVLLLEHESVYTAGRRSRRSEYPTDGTPVVPVDRGGKVTWHGPGQLVGYPVVRLRNRLGVVDFVRVLEDVLIETVAALGVEGVRIPERSGVWSRGVDGSPPEKLAQIGLHAADGIVTHGFALNCSNSLAPFAGFVPCGLTDAGVATLSTLAGRTITPAEVIPVLTPCLLRAIEEVAE